MSEDNERQDPQPPEPSPDPGPPDTTPPWGAVADPDATAASEPLSSSNPPTGEPLFAESSVIEDTGAIPPQSAAGRAGRVLPWVLLGVFVLASAAVGLVAYRAHRDRQQMAESTRDLLWMVKAHADDEQSQQAIAQAITAVSGGDYERAAELVGQITPRLESSSSPSLPLIDQRDRPLQPTREEIEEALTQLPEEARAYFRDNPDIFLAFVEQCNIARELREDGENVDDLRALRNAIIEAGGKNDDGAVKDLLGKMTTLAKLTGNKDQILAELQPSIDEFRSAVEEAARQGRDPSGAVELMHKSEQAAAAGDIERARQYLQQGIQAAQSAPRGAGRPAMAARAPSGAGAALRADPRRIAGADGRRTAIPGVQGYGGPPMGPEAQERQFAPQRDLSQMLLQGLMALTSAEDVDLGAAYERITNAKIAVREKNAEQVREILDGALERFAVIGQRRHEFSKAAAAFIAESAQEGRASDPDDRQSAMAGRRQQGRDGQTGTGEPRAPRERQGAGEQTGWLDQGLGERFGVGAMGDAARAAVVDGMLSIIARARTLTDDEFTGRTDAIAREIEQLLSARQAQRTDRGGDDGWPAIAGIRGYETAEQKAAAAERIRTKLRVAGEEYMEAKASGRDTALIEEVDGLLTRARISLYAEEYIESEELVNEAMRKLGLEVEPVDADAESTRPRRGPGRGR